MLKHSLKIFLSLKRYFGIKGICEVILILKQNTCTYMSHMRYSTV